MPSRAKLPTAVVAVLALIVWGLLPPRTLRTAPPPDSGDLQLGLPPAREGGPAYVRSGLGSGAGQGELYGRGTLPQGF
mgnify:CR=1 FL=1